MRHPSARAATTAIEESGFRMAQIKQRLAQNTGGEFYVDASCIDCDTCRQIAPETFRDHGGQSSVYHQPDRSAAVRRALMALVACPTASIGTVSRLPAREGVAAFPSQVVDNVYFCGYTSEASFGAWSYLIVRPPGAGGNVLVDSPRFTAPLVKGIERMGGVALMFLSHRDDIADHARFAAHFRCPRMMHQDDGAGGLGVERIVSGDAPRYADDDLLLIPTPGHTRGHQVLLYGGKVLFTGDHLAWSPELQTLTASREVCWYSWAEQIRSMEKLLDYRFEWVLPGHGRIGHAAVEPMRRHLQDCIRRMRNP